MSLSSARSAQLLIYLMEQADKRFFSMLKKKFTWEEVTHRISEKFHSLTPSLQVMDDPARAKYSQDAISLLQLTRKRSS